MAIDALLLNLTRFGDLLQTQAVIDDLHIAGHSVGLVCLENFSPALSLLKHVDGAWPMPGGCFLSSLDNNWPLAIQEADNFIQKVKREARPKYVINLTPSLAARLLTSLLASNESKILGFGLDEYGFGVNYGLWSSFLAVAASNRCNSPFNLTDMFRMLAAPLSGAPKGSNLLRMPAPVEVEWAREFLASAKKDFLPSGFIAFQPGASEERRRWPIGHFAELAARLWQSHKICPVLLGSAQEQGLAKKYAQLATTPFVDAIGKTTLPRLAALLSQCKLLVTNDTGTMHLSAGLSLPSLSFFLATAQPWDTGPSLANCCCLEPALACHPCSFGNACEKGEMCRQQISAKSAATLVSAFLLNNSWRIDADSVTDCRIWVTEYDNKGLQNLIPLNREAQTGPGLWLSWQRRFWTGLLNHLDLQIPIEQAASPYHGLGLPEENAVMSKYLFQASEILNIISEGALAASQSTALGKIFLKNCERLHALLAEMPQMSSLAIFWHELQSVHGDNLQKFSNQTKIMKDHIHMLAKALQG